MLQHDHRRSSFALPADAAAFERAPAGVIDFHAVRATQASQDPYPHLLAADVLYDGAKTALRDDFPDIARPGFFPLSEMKVEGAFKALIHDFTSDEFASILSDKLGIELRDKPRLITVRKWSAAGDGRIHNDSESKIASALIYLNDNWPASGEGCFRVLKNDASFADYVHELPPVTGAMIAFKRTPTSWHGHLPFVGERRVVQMAYLRSQADLERKTRRGRWSLFLKKLNPLGRT